MRRKIATGMLRDERIVQIEYLSLADLSKIMQLQEKVKQALDSDAFLSPLSKEEYTHILTENGFMAGAFVGKKLIAFRAMLIPEIDEEHLGLDAGLSQTELPQVIYSEISNVDPDYRGNGLQNYMGKLLIRDIDHKRFKYVCATVAPMNIPSIKDKLSLRMHIVGLKEKYDGKLRYIFMKGLTVSYKDSDFDEMLWILGDDIDEQQRLIQSGFRGISIKKDDGYWYVKYGR